jgi:integrase
MARLYRRHDDGNWYGDYNTPEGKRVQGSLRTKDKTVAKERLRLAELGATPSSRGKKQRLMDAIDGMIASLHTKADGTKSMYRVKGRRLLKTLGNPWVHEVDAAMLDKYITRRRSDEPEHGGAADHTIQKELITVRRALKYALKSKTLQELPHWPEFSPDYDPRKVWLTEPQFEALCSELEPERRLWASLCALAGCRSGEAERVTWEMVNFATNRIRVPGSKTDLSRDRPVPIAPALLARLRAVPKAEREGPVAGRWANVNRDLGLAVNRCNAKATAEAKVTGRRPPPPMPKVTPNDLRRTFASWLVQQGVPALTVAALMGHSTTRMIEKVYGKLSAANLDAAIAMMPRGGVTHGVTNSVADPVEPDPSGHILDDPENE